MICSYCGRDIDALGQVNVSCVPGEPMCEDCARWSKNYEVEYEIETEKAAHSADTP